VLLVGEGRTAEGLDKAQQANKLAPNDPIVLDTYGWATFKSGDAPGALKILTKASVSAPQSAATLYHLGEVQWALGDGAAAKASLAQSLKLSTSFRGANEARARLDKLAK
jgi:Tfp pilus assembly protein PilF